MCSLWRENYSKNTHCFLIKLLISMLSPTLFPPSHFPFFPQFIKKMESFALLLQKKSIFVAENEADPTERFRILTVPIYMKRGTPYIVSVFIKSSIIN